MTQKSKNTTEVKKYHMSQKVPHNSKKTTKVQKYHRIPKMPQKSKISWSEKSTFGFWEEEKYDFDLIYQQYNKSKNITKVKKSNSTTNVQKYHRYKKYHKSKNSTSHKIPQKSKYITKSKKTTITQKIQRKPNNTTKAQK